MKRERIYVVSVVLSNVLTVRATSEEHAREIAEETLRNDTRGTEAEVEILDSYNSLEG